MTTGRSSLTTRVGLVLVGATMAMMVRSVAAPIDDTDVWWNLRLGHDLLRHPWWGTPPQLSSFATAAWAPTEPLPEVVGAKVEEWFGLPGLAWLYGLGLVAVLLAIYFSLRQIASTLPASLATMFAVLTCTQSLTPRPQLVSLCLLPVVVVAWVRSADDLRPRWWLVPLFWFWSCCHGFWFVGALVGLLVSVTVVIVRRPARPVWLGLLGTALGSCAVVLLTPAGPRVLLAPFVVRDRSAYIIEWHRTDLPSPAALVALGMIVAATALCLRARRYDAVCFALLVAALFFTWYSSRTVSVGGILAAVVLAAGLESLLAAGEPETPRARRAEAVGLLAWAAVCLGVLALVVPHTSTSPAEVPDALDAQLDSLPAGTVVLDSYETGGWLAWRHPDLDHYIDPLADAYPVSHLEDYVRVLYARPGWQRVLHDSGARAALLQEQVPLADALRARGWTEQGRAQGYVLLTAPGSNG